MCRLQNILHFYHNSFGLLPHELMWQKYERVQWGPDTGRRKSAKRRSISTRIPTKIDEEENE